MKAKLSAPTRFGILVIGILAVVAIIMLPRKGEWWAVMQDEGRGAQIVALLKPRLAAEPDNTRLLATLARAYAEIGQRQKAIELLERFIVLRPKDADAYARLARLYGEAGDPVRRIARLEQSVAIASTPARVAELAAAYREQHMSGAELALLSRFEADLTLEHGLLRLAELQDSLGDRKTAIQTLTRPSVLNSASASASVVDARILLARLLVQSGRAADAVSLGKQWILQWHEPWLSNRLLRAIVLHAPVAQASELADAAVASHPEIRLYVAHELAKMGAKPVALHLLAGWSTAIPSPSLNEIAGFLSACRKMDASDIVWQAFARVLGHPEAPDIIGRYTEAIAAEFGIGALAPFWSKMPRAVIAGNPLLVARLAFHEKDLATARWLVERIDPATLKAADRQLWIDLLTAVAPPAEAVAVLRQWQIDGQLGPDLLARYARLAVSREQQNEFRAALDKTLPLAN